MPYLNSVTIMGHLGRDADVRHTSNGKTVASFSVATTAKWKDKGGSPQERTTWHRVTKWDPPEWMTAGLTKGSLVYVQGSLETRQYEKDGQKRETTEIKADTVLLLAARERSSHAASADRFEDGDDVPF